MLAVITRVENGYTARFERHLKHSAEKVWSFLTENDKLVQWFSELEIDELREGGLIKFNMPDGTIMEIFILELKLYSVLEYTWAENQVRFELYPEPGGCRLVFIEKLNKIINHTSTDLAGWHVCLEVIQALLEGKTIESRTEIWKIWHEKYDQLLKR